MVVFKYNKFLTNIAANYKDSIMLTHCCHHYLEVHLVWSYCCYKDLTQTGLGHNPGCCTAWIRCWQ